MNEVVDCVLDGKYWNETVGDRRERKKKTKIDATFTFPLSWMPKKKAKKGPPRILTEEEKQRKKEERAKLKAEIEALREQRKTVLEANEERQREGIELFPGVILGGRLAALNYESLVEKHVKLIVNVTKDIKNYYQDEPENPFEYFRIGIEDLHTEPIGDYFDEATTLMSNALNAGKVVFIHCRQCQSRSPTVAIALGMKHFGMTLEMAYNTALKQIGEFLTINDGFKKQLMAYELRLCNKPTIDFFTKRESSGVQFFRPDDECWLTPSQKRRRSEELKPQEDS